MFPWTNHLLSLTFAAPYKAHYIRFEYLGTSFSILDMVKSRQINDPPTILLFHICHRFANVIHLTMLGISKSNFIPPDHCILLEAIDVA